jgi:two-component system, chemotaxis family, chemotaxis protein CheY
MSLKQQLQVMIVDDTSVSRSLIMTALDQIGVMNHVSAKDGQDALKRLMAKPVHLVISDMNMPGLDGLGLLKALREYKPTSSIGFILVTGSPDKTLLARGRQYGLNNFIAKPFTKDTMKSTIESVVGRLT